MTRDGKKICFVTENQMYEQEIVTLDFDFDRFTLTIVDNAKVPSIY